MKTYLTMPRPRWPMRVLLLLGVGVAACDGGGPVTPSEPTLRVEPEVLDLRAGDVGQLTTLVTGIENPTLTFLSSNTAVAVSSPTGLVTALGEGTASIAVTVEGAPNLSAVAFVRVSAGPPADSVRVRISPAAVFVAQGDSVRLTATVEGIAAQTVQWRSVDPAVATVSASGVVRGQAQGTAVILAFSTAVPQAVGTATIRVLPPPPVTVSIAPAAASIRVGESLDLAASVQGTSNQTVGWTSPDTTIARVSAAGRVTGVGPGVTVIRATSVAQPSAVANSTITVGSVGLIVEPPQAALEIADTITLRARVAGLSDTTVVWQSSLPGVASVDAETGLVTALAPGTAFITARSTAAPQATASAVITVQAPAQGGSLSLAAIHLVDPATGERLEASPSALSGLIEVTANLPPEPTGTKLELVVDGSVEAIRDLPSGTADTASIQLLTSAFDEVTGAPDLLNGPHTLSLWLVDSLDQVVAVASVPIGLANPDGFALGIEALGSTATNPNTGDVWARGDVRTRAVPVIYSGSFAIARVRLGLCRVSDGAVLTSGVDATREDGFSVVFDDQEAPSVSATTGGVAGMEALVEACVVSSQTNAGAVGPTLVLNARPDLWPAAAPPRLGVDNKAPVIPARFTLDRDSTAVWIPASFEFTRASTGLGGSDAVLDEGVNAVTCSFLAGPSYDALIPVTRGSDLPESQTNTAYVARVVCADALGNAGSRNLSDGQGNPQTFGVDYP